MQLLNVCLEIEETLGKIYRHFAEHGPGEESLRGLWQQLAEDEVQHALQIRFLLRLPSDGVIEGERLPLATAKAMLDYAKKALAEIREKSINEATALQLARKLEKDFSRVHASVALDFQQEKTRAMISALAKADELHDQLLADYGKRATTQAV